MDFCTDSRVVADDIINTFSHIIKAPGFHSQAPKLFIQGLVLLCLALYWVLGHEQGQVPGWGASGLVGITFIVGSLPLSPAIELSVIRAVTHQDVPRTSPPRGLCCVSLSAVTFLPPVNTCSPRGPGSLR